MTPPVSPTLVQSPSLTSPGCEEPAFELKFQLTLQQAEQVQAWAGQRLSPDPHGVGGAYSIATVYLDTPLLDVYHKSAGYRRSKFRLRRYNQEEVIHLERKKRRGDQVRKRREMISLAELTRLCHPNGGGTWFGPRVHERQLRPMCWIGYQRTAYMGQTSAGPIRLTLDRHIVGARLLDWQLPDRLPAQPLLTGEVILELKFRSALPALFHELLPTLQSRNARSKYARCVEACHLNGGCADARLVE